MDTFAPGVTTAAVWTGGSGISLEKVEATANEATLEIKVSYVRRETGERREEVFRHPVLA